MEEIWKDIEGYDGLYQVSNLGRIKSLYNYRGYGNIMTQRIKKGYCTIGLRKNGLRKWLSVHRIVANMFIPDKTSFKAMPNEDRNSIDLKTLKVNHKDENKLNNNVDNLEWCTTAYNNSYGDRLSRVSKTNKLKRTVVQCDLDGTILNMFSSIRKAAETTGTRISGISMCINKKQRTANGFVWISESEVMLNDQ